MKINGERLDGWIDWEVNNNTHQMSDTFRVVYNLSQLPVQFGADWWASQATITAEVFAGFPPDPLNFSDSNLPPSWIYGNVDEIDYDPVQTQVTITGRDLTALLIDTKTTEQWRNKTSSQIAQILADRHGFVQPANKADAIVPTSVEAGAYYKQDTIHTNDQRSEWDLLTYLARKEEYVVYVSGRTLYFKPKPDPASVVPYVIEWTPAKAADTPHFDGVDLKFSRNLTVAKGVIVIAYSTIHKAGVALKAVYPKNSKPTTAGTSGTSKQVYTFNLTNKTQQQLDEFVANKHREITRHEMKLSASLLGDDYLTNQSVIRVAGTGSQFDQTYFPDEVIRRMSLTDGYSMSVTAKNHNTDTETLA